MKEDNLVNVGDKIYINSGMGMNWFIITRVTKTLAMSKRSDGYEYKFKRLISRNMSHPHQAWTLHSFKVERAG